MPRRTRQRPTRRCRKTARPGSQGTRLQAAILHLFGECRRWNDGEPHARKLLNQQASAPLQARYWEEHNGQAGQDQKAAGSTRDVPKAGPNACESSPLHAATKGHTAYGCYAIATRLCVSYGGTLPRGTPAPAVEEEEHVHEKTSTKQ